MEPLVVEEGGTGFGKDLREAVAPAAEWVFQTLRRKRKWGIW
jgi:hypothetical protein